MCGGWKSSSHASSSSREAWAISPPEWLDRAWDRTLTAEASLGMVLALGDKVALQWHLDSVQGDELWERPFLSPWADVWEWCQELLLDLLWARMLSSGHLTWSRACPLYTVPQSSPGSPRRLVCVVGNGLRPRSPCRCACTGQPAPFTKGSSLEVRVTHRPTMPHHRPPT